MQLIMFTKFFRGLSPDEIGDIAVRMGFDGLDVAVRDGQCVSPDNVTTAMPAALARWKAHGLSAPLVTLRTDAVDPAAPDVQAIFAACGAAGIPNIKLGYWNWPGQKPYWEEVDTIRRALDGFAALGKQHGVRSLVHTHSGCCFASNAAGAMHLVRGFDPRYVGVYLDPAHLALDGEHLPMALDMVGDYLSMIGVKNARCLPVENGQGWWTDFCLLADGLVDWSATVQLLHASGYDGPLSIHGEYTAIEDTATVMERVEVDMAHLKPAVTLVGA